MKDAYYFSHDSNASNDPKILSMRCDYGLSGYGMYWVIIEALRNEADYKLQLDKCTYRALAMQMHSKNDTLEKYINDCINEYELFKSDGATFWAESLLKRMERLEEIRMKRKAAAEKRWDNKEPMQKQCKSNASAMQRDAKESKVKESKEKKSTYGEFKNVLLTDEQLEKLKVEFPDYKERIENLSEGIELKGYVYKNHLLAIKKWAKKDIILKPKEILQRAELPEGISYDEL